MPSSITFTSRESGSARSTTPPKVLVEAVSMLDRIDAGLGNRGFQIFDAVAGKPSAWLRSGRTHGHLLVTDARGQSYFHRGGFLARSFRHLRRIRSRIERWHNANAVMSSVLGPPSANASCGPHASRIPSPSGWHLQIHPKAFRPNSSSP